MKKIRIMIAAIMIGLMVIGWVSQIGNSISLNNKYKAYIASAEAYMEQGLYQKAIIEYDNAYAIKNSNKVLKSKVEAYRMSYEEGTSTAKEYAVILEEYCKNNEKDVEGWKALLTLYIDNADYKSAYSVVKMCFDLGDKDEDLERIMDDIIYSFKTSRKTYTQYYRSPNGYYTLYDDKNWGIMDTTGEWLYECEYQYVGPINQNLDSLMVSSLGKRVFNEDGVTQAILSKHSDITRAYGDGYIPMQNSDGKWQFYSCDEDKYVWDIYENVTAFQDEVAFVYDGSKWYCIDIEGKQIGKTKYDDVKIYSNGEYCYSDMFVASQDGKYYLFDRDGEKKTESSYEDMDVYLGEYIAYMDKDGKWGFIDDEGEIVIKPAYQEAKSFSNGLAAVFDGEKWGFINKDGDLVIDYQFREADYFTEDGICFVSTYEDLYYMITLRFN